MTDLDRLTTLVPPPAEDRSRPEAWQRVRGQLGFDVPADYRALVDTYGAGVFANFIHIYQPAATLKAIDLAAQINDALSALRQLRDGGENIPYQLDDPAELIAAGRTDNGDVIYWHRTPETLDRPDEWTITVNESRGEDWIPCAGTLTAFLADVFSRQTTIAVFPAKFPPEHPTFEPYEP